MDLFVNYQIKIDLKNNTKKFVDLWTHGNGHVAIAKRRHCLQTSDFLTTCCESIVSVLNVSN